MRGARPSVDECIEALYSSLTDTSLLPDSVELIRQRLDAATASYFFVDLRGEPMAFTAANHDADTVARWSQRYVYLDPYRIPCSTAKPGHWVTDDSLLDPVRSPQPEYVNDFARGAGMRWLTGGKVLESDRGHAFFTVHRPEHQRAFDSESLATLDELFPHLQRVSRLMLTLERPLAALAAARQGLDLMTVGCCGLDVTGRLVYSNPAMQSFFDRWPHVIRVHGATLEFGTARVQGALLSVIGRLAQGVRHSGHDRGARLQPESFAVKIGATGSMVIRLVPLAPDNTSPFPLDAARLMVFATLSPDVPDQEQLRQTFGFTSAECEVLCLLISGRTPEECAKDRNTGIATVRSQISSMLQKAGVASQVQLLALVLAMPPVNR